jgi:hypothetical protein
VTYMHIAQCTYCEADTAYLISFFNLEDVIVFYGANDIIFEVQVVTTF